MPGPHVMVMSSGGLRSLVAAATVLGEAETPRLSLLHVVDGRDNGMLRLEHTRRQAEHWHITRVVEVDLPHIFSQGKAPDGVPIGTLAEAQMLTAGLALARVHQAERLIWPASYNGQTRAVARATELQVLCEHLADLAGGPMPRLDAPLLELTDQQLIELGGQLDVPWHLAWSCLVNGDRPCRVCPACRRRKAAFESAGMVDPIEKLLVTAR